jgi:hypothetical protein
MNDGTVVFLVRLPRGIDGGSGGLRATATLADGSQTVVQADSGTGSGVTVRRAVAGVYGPLDTVPATTR